MSAPLDRLTPAPVRQDAPCMCASGGRCTSFAPGHAVHLIQARLVSATPTEWVDALVTFSDAQRGEIVLHTLGEGARIEVWNGAGAGNAVTVGAPVAYHPRYHVLSVGEHLFNALPLP